MAERGADCEAREGEKGRARGKTRTRARWWGKRGRVVGRADGESPRAGVTGICKWRLAVSVGTSRTPFSLSLSFSPSFAAVVARERALRARSPRRDDVKRGSAFLIDTKIPVGTCGAVRRPIASACIVHTISLSLSLSFPAAPVPSLSFSLFSLPPHSLHPPVRRPLPASSPPLSLSLSLALAAPTTCRPARALACVSSAVRGNRGSLPGVCASMLSGALRRIRVQATWRKVRWCYDSGF